MTGLKVGRDYIPRNFFVSDYSLIEDLEKKCLDEHLPLYQNMHDELLSHFYQQYGQ